MRIFVTGGAGYLGRAILRRPEVFSPGPIDWTIYSRDEAKHAHARAEFPDAHFILGDVRDRERLELAMRGHDVVIHAAAMKYVPQGETNVWEAIAVNVDGSRNVALAAAATGVKELVAISTDKACRPVNVYGMTKLMMERLYQEANGWGGPQVTVVRYGNVIGSTGSVIPFFRRQAREGRITLTNPHMTRFWLTIEDAVGLIADALRARRGGMVLIPRLSSATMKVVARAAVLAELGPDNKVKTETIGQRFGEKVHEELLAPEEAPYAEPGALMQLYPVGEGLRKQPITFGYTSNTPDHIIETPEMVKLIEESNE